ncbi:LOW QUALITY PROTEIN: olfactory receptor 5J3-like [Pantherophis guttatus]|uniref:LOW QUALITY PROTEIN: olfactory receptor 5J3-like n=1 Tax=Pantherophis guttatus TaxID=94885 RepID=A0ABM3Z4B5_PANGU|nr:LOW QUALITY PROTEIN: olfactory receptor 5J3-like [Pantherophis guttatus]
MENTTWVTELILTGLTDDLQLQLILFVTFFAAYAIILVGNVSMIFLIRLSPQLHTPMYFFLTHLSFLNICCSSSITPKFLCHLLTEKKVISLAGCFTQLYFYALFSTAECFLLAIMAYDRYVAICHPLLYLVTVSQIKCVQLVVVSYITGFVHGLVHIIPAFQLFFCGPNIIKNFLCEGPALLQLACSDTYILITILKRNRTQVTEFILTGLTDDPHLQLILFMIFFTLYAITLLGNVGMIVLIWISPQLHTPMYFFLSHVSFVDICCSSAITPNFLCHLVKEKKVISFAGCFTQLYFYGVFSTAEYFLLAIMAYDRYVAICHPLLYLVTMSQIKCVQLVVVSYITGVVHGLLHIIPASQLFFCGPNIIKNFVCEGPALLQLACSDISLNNLLKFIFIGFTLITTMLIVLTSYICILITILKMHSAKSRKKAFSTCTSHLMVITIFYGCLSFMYVRPSSRQNYHLDQMASVFYVVVTPMLNPLIYSMRNQEVRRAFRNILERKFHVLQL